GIVWQAMDLDLDREVAVKLLREEHEISRAVIRRFVTEARIAGRLQHPGIVPVYELGAFSDGRVYLVMKLVTGRSLTDLLRSRGSELGPLPELLQVFERVCQTIAYAHERGVIHRDLTPANIVVGEFDAVQVMDWGIAKVLGASPDPEELSREEARKGETVQDMLRGQQTREGSVLGTPGYMAPEQAQGRLDQLDERCDVFALGAILFEIVTARPLRSL